MRSVEERIADGLRAEILKKYPTFESVKAHKDETGLIPVEIIRVMEHADISIGECKKWLYGGNI